MIKFLRLIASEPEICSSSNNDRLFKWHVIEQGLKNIQGKGIVNSYL